MDTDFIIIDVEVEVTSRWQPYSHFCNFRFVDQTPHKPKLHKALYELTKNEDLEVIDYNYTETPITAETNLKYFDITIN